MTTSHSSGRRHRGRRGRRSGNRGAGTQPNQEQSSNSGQLSEEVAVLPDLADVTPPPIQAAAPAAAPAPAPIQTGRPRVEMRPPMRPARRRQPPRQPVGPMPMDVLKRGLVLREPEFPLQLRPLATMIDGTAANFGCPMLHRNQTALPATGFQRAARCSLGWSIHNQDEAMLCMYTPEMIDCWKAHPEKVEGLVAKIREDEESAAAD